MSHLLAHLFILYYEHLFCVKYFLNIRRTSIFLFRAFHDRTAALSHSPFRRCYIY